MNKTYYFKSLAVGALVFLSACSNIEHRSDEPVKQPLAALLQPAVNARVLWRYHISGGGIGKVQANMSMVRDAQHLLVANAAGHLVALNDDGKVVWQRQLGESITAGIVTAMQQLFVVNQSGQVLSLDLLGKEQWRGPKLGEIFAEPTVHHDVVFVQTLDGSILALHQGQQLWRFHIEQPGLRLRRSSKPLVAGQRLFVGLADGHIIALNVVDGSLEWQYDLAENLRGDDWQRMVDISADLVYRDDTVYAVSYKGYVAALTPSGELLWKQPAASIAGLVLDHKLLYLAAVDGSVVAMQRTDGRSVWQQQALLGRKLTRPVKQGKYIVVGDNDGYLHWLDASQGKIAGRLKITGKGITQLLLGPEHLYAYSIDGTVVAVNIL
jgi:outer membrane protein assembly factor BamB